MKPRLATLGWREWVALPGVGLERIKVKVDTGARTSALHAFSLDTFTRRKSEWVRFGVHPIQTNRSVAVTCEAPIKDRRKVTDSGGHSERRIVIETEVVIGAWRKIIELTLTDRDTMRFRMLLGRTALAGSFLVDSRRSYVAGDPHHTTHVKRR